jgi:hypothetical protein
MGQALLSVLRKYRSASFDRNDAFALFHIIEVVDGQVSEDFRLPRRPKDFDFIDAFPAAEAEVNSEIMLGEVTAPGAQERTRRSDRQGERAAQVAGDDPVHPQKKNRPAASLTRLLAGLSYILPC